MEKALQKKQDLEYINIIRIVALLLVILAHSSAVYTGAWGFKLVNNKSEGIKYINNYFQTFRMPLFIFVSGYLYYFNRVKMNKYNSFSKFVKNKGQRLLIPYLVTGIFFMIPVQMIFNIYSDSEGYFYKVFREILFAKMPGHLWFLLSLFQIFIVFYLIEKYLKSKKINLNPIIIIIFLSFIGFITRNIPNVYQIQSSIEYFIYFYIGYLCSQNIEYLKENSSKVIYVFLIHFLLFNIQYFILNSIRNTKVYIIGFKFVLRQLTSILGIISVFIYSIKFSRNKTTLRKIKSNKIVKLINENKFYIYLVHQPVLKVILVNISNLDINPFLVINLLFWPTLFISLCISISYKKARKLVNKVFI